MLVQDDILKFQRELLLSDVPNIAVSGGLGLGKTALAARFAVYQMVKYPGSKGALACPTYPQLFQSDFIEIEQLLAKYGIRYKFQPQYKKLSISNGSMMFFQSFDVPESRLKGPEWDWGVIDEDDSVEFPSYQRFADRIGRDIKQKGSGLLRVFGNPVPFSHWVYEEYRLKELPGHELWEISTYENRRYLARGYIEKLEARYPEGTPGRERWLMGKCGVPSEKAVYSDFNLRTDTVTDEQIADEGGFARHMSGAYFGRDGLPAGYILAGKTRQGTIVALKEVYTRQQPVGRTVSRIADIHAGGRTFADRSHALYSDFRKAGLKMRGARIDRTIGTARLREIMAEGRFKIRVDSRKNIACPQLRAELESHEMGEAHQPQVENCSLIIPLEYIACGQKDTIDAAHFKRLGLADVFDNEPREDIDHRGGKLLSLV